MIKRIQQCFFVIVILYTGLGYIAQAGEEFVVKRDKTSALSASRMKEDIGEQLFNTFGQLIDTLDLLTQAQKELFDASCHVLKEECLNACKKPQLNTIHQKAHEVQAETKRVMKDVEQLLRTTQSLNATLHKK
jgi:hypothetical protein